MHTQPNPAPTTSEPAQATDWYLAYTKPQQEHIAQLNLERQGYVTYLPLYKHCKNARKRGLASAEFVREPMFPRYVFFHPASPRQSITAARSTRGVSTLVSFASGPAAIGDELVASIRSLEQQREQADLQTVSPFQPGTRVRLRDQGLKGLAGIVLSITNKRVTILLEILGRQQLVEVQHNMIELH